MKRVMVCLVTLFFSVSSAFAYEAVSVMDADSGRILFEKNGDKRYLIASTTKIMTALVTINNNENLDEIITIGDEVLEAYGSSIYIKPQEKMSIRDLLYGLMMRSGNDAAMTLAVHTAGSIEGFASLMNDTALMIGMHESKFYNPHGLDEDTENKSTTNDMCLLMQEAMKNEEFKKITGEKKHAVKTNFTTYEWFNKNRLLSDYKYATGGKIGYTMRAKHTFVSSATKDDKNLIIATFVDSDRFDSHKELYEKYFAKYKKYTLIDKDNLAIDYKAGYKLYTTSSFAMLLTEDEKKRVEREVEMYNFVEETSNTKIIGTINISLDGISYKKLNIYAEAIEKPKTFWEKVKEFFKW